MIIPMEIITFSCNILLSSIISQEYKYSIFLQTTTPTLKLLLTTKEKYNLVFNLKIKEIRKPLLYLYNY